MAATDARSMFENLLQRAGKKKKGKEQKKAENEIVENLERSLTKEDPLLENNTYDGEAEKNLKNLRNNGGKGKENKDTEVIEDTKPDIPKKAPRTKKSKKKPKTKEVAEVVNDTDLYTTVNKPEKNVQGNTEEQVVDEPTEEPPKPVPTPRKDKGVTVPKTVEDPEENRVPEQEEGQTPGNEEETVPKTVVRRKRRKKKGPARALPSTADTSQQEQSQEEQQESEPISEPQPPPSEEVLVDTPLDPSSDVPNVIEDDGTILGVTVHYCDHIRVDPKYVAHPLVKISIVDEITGRFFTKGDSSRHVSSFYESESVNSIVPLLTQPYDFKSNRSLLPRWEELVIFNESFTRLTHRPNTLGASTPILFFVIRDFVTMAKANNKKGTADKGWHNVAWAFLKLVSSNGQPNAGRRMRLQLFYPPSTRGMLQDPNIDPVHDWWLNYPRVRYPGTLFVTVKAILPPLDLQSSLRSLSALQREESAMTFNQLNESLERAESEGQLRTDDDDFAAMQQWSRLPGQTCKIPNAPFRRFWAGSEGAFMLRFSHKGTRLAAACRHETTYPILLYGIPGGEEIGIIIGHQQLVYDLQWSNNDKYLLSASADGTAQVWDMEHAEKPIHTLPHPCYVYTASFHSTAQHIIATGGYDSIVRIWNIASITSQLTQEIDGHKAIINSIIFDSTGLNMYSADGAGVIICWNCRSHEKAKKNIKTNWTMRSKIEDRDLAGVCINSLALHPQNNKILIHCRDSTVRLLDSRIHSTKKFTGLLNYRQLLRSSVTPCGSLIFSGSEDGFVYVWNVDTGDQVAIYNELGYTSAVHVVAYHPHDHMVAFCSYAANQSILVYKFNSAVATLEAGFGQEDQADGQKEEIGPSVNAHIEAAKTAVNLQRIKHQLDSVLSTGEDFHDHPSFIHNNLHQNETGTLDTSGNSFLPPIPRGQDAHAVAAKRSPRSPSPYGRKDLMSTWGSTFDDSSTQFGSALAPSYLSPHASPDARAMAQQYVRSGRQDPSGAWRPGAAPVGGSPYRSHGAGLPPDVSFSMDKDGNQRLNISTVPGTRSQCVVVVLFEYQANRSDELTVVRGDIIRVLYKDSANWWFGEKSDGTQGYFPSNYVEEQVPTGEMNQASSQAPVFGVPDSEPEKKVYALKMPGGRLNFYSQSESEGDDERLSSASVGSRQRRREARLKDTLERSRQTPSPLTVLDKSTKSSDAPYPKSILQKNSPRPKITVQGPSSEAVNIKEVSFADEKKEDKVPKVKQNLFDSVQAVIQKTEEPKPVTEETPKTPSPSAKPRQSKTKTKARKSTRTKPPPGYDESSFTQKADQAGTPTPKVDSEFSILKQVQAMMNQNKNDSAFSQSVLGGHGISTPEPSETKNSFKPTVHSTAVKKPRSPVENDEDPLTPPITVGSVIRKARPLPKIGKPLDEESIPMVSMRSNSKPGRRSPMGLSNPAFDSTP